MFSGLPDLGSLASRKTKKEESELSSLSGLANLSLKPDEGPSLSDIAAKDDSTSLFSLDSLSGLRPLKADAEDHGLAAAGFLKSVDLNSGISLSSLAAAAASGTSPEPLFGGHASGQLPGDAEPLRPASKTSVSSLPSIDLTSALRLEPLKPDVKNKSQAKSTKSSYDLLTEPSENGVLDQVELLLDYQHSRLVEQVRKPSAFARVLCNKWNNKKKGLKANRRTSQLKSAPTLCCDKVKRFAFDAPSPDDIVRAAQSKVFRRH